MTDQLPEEPKEATDVLSESDDEFNDFNEGGDDFGDFEETPGEAQLEEQASKAAFQYQGDYKSQADEIDKLVSQFISSVGSEPSKDAGGNVVLSERAQSLYQRLVKQEPNMKKVNWKQSFVRRQLLLNLGIPINLDELNPQSSYGGGSRGQLNAYDAELLSEVPPFDKTKLTEDQWKKVIETTDSRIEHFHSELQTTSYYRALEERDNAQLPAQLEKLQKVKQELLTMVSCWDKKVDGAKRDNELFSSYMENLIGNTQKMRRNQQKS